MVTILAHDPAPPPATTAAPGKSAGLKDLWPAIVLGLCGLVWLVGTTLANTKLADSGSGGQLLVIGPPATDRTGVYGIVWQAGGAVMGHGGLPNIAIAASDQPDFAAALTAAGAWLVLPSPRLLGCFSDAGTGTGAGTATGTEVGTATGTGAGTE